MISFVTSLCCIYMAPGFLETIEEAEVIQNPSSTSDPEAHSTNAIPAPLTALYSGRYQHFSSEELQKEAETVFFNLYIPVNRC